MIIGSILLILVAAALFAGGLYRDSGSFYYSSIVISVLAAVALVGGLRQARGRLAFGDDFDLGQASEPASAGPWAVQPEQAFGATSDSELPTDELPRDEPAEEILSRADMVALARLSVAVAVVDGRPRYHLPGCLHLLGRQVERLSLQEALGADFSSCGQCRPASGLLARRRDDQRTSG